MSKGIQMQYTINLNHSIPAENAKRLGALLHNRIVQALSDEALVDDINLALKGSDPRFDPLLLEGGVETSLAMRMRLL